MEKDNANRGAAAPRTALSGAKIEDLLDRSYRYWTTYQRYHAECQRHCIERGVKHIPAEEWNEATRAAVEKMHEADEALRTLLEELFPHPENAALWEAYYAKFYGPDAAPAAPKEPQP